jgi:hypothetical protein
MEILPIWKSSPPHPLAQWVRQLRAAVNDEDPRQAGRLPVLLSALADGAVRLSREDYAAHRAQWLQLAAAEDLAGPGMSGHFERFAVELSALMSVPSSSEVAVAELSVSPLPGLLADAPGRGDSYLLVVHPQFPTFANLLAKVAAYAIPIEHGPKGAALATSVDGWADALTITTPAVQRYRELAVATLAGRPSSAPAYMPPHAIASLVPPLRDAMEMFAVAQLLAHLAGGDQATRPAVR